MDSAAKQDDLPELRIDAERQAELCVLRLGGELDLTSAGQLVDAATEACTAGAKELVIDIAGLDFIDSTGLRAILDAKTVSEEHLCRFRLTPPRDEIGDQVRRLLQITGLLDRLPFETSPDAQD